MARLGAFGGSGWTRTSGFGFGDRQCSRYAYAPTIPLARPAGPVTAVGWLWAISKLEPLIAALIALPNLCHTLAHVYIVHAPCMLYTLFRRPGYARDDLHWAATIAGNGRLVAILLRVQLT